MEVRNDELGVVFSLPEATTQNILRYDGAVELAGRGLGMYERLWLGVRAVAQDWQCEHVGMLDNLGKVDPRPATLAVIKWAGLAVFTWASAAKDVPKNS